MYFITFSEMVGTTGRVIANEVARRLYFPFYGDQELFKTADEMGFLPETKKADEKEPAFFDRWFSQKPRIYLDRLQSVIYDMAKRGDGVFFGRGSQLLLKSFHCALHILVIGSKEKRIERITGENEIRREVAEILIERSDHEKRGFLRFAFDEDWMNPRLYDLVLNTDKLGVPSAVDMVLSAAKSDGVKACGIDSLKELARLSLERKVEAALLGSGLMKAHHFVSVEDTDSVRLFGVASTTEEKEAIEKSVRGIREVKRIQSDLMVWQDIVARKSGS